MTNNQSNFSDRLTPQEVQKTLDALGIEWQNHKRDPDGWINISNPEFESDFSINVNTGGWVDRYYHYQETERPDGGPTSGDLVSLVAILEFLPHQNDKAIRWIKKIVDLKPARSRVHIFHVEDAKKYDITGAVILQGIRTWLDHNKAEKRNIRNGRVWTYNKREAFTEYHPYLTDHQIRYQLEKLEEDGILLTGQFNKNKYDQTLWYSVNEPKYTVSNKLTELGKFPNGVEKIPNSN